ncbi:cytochrome P450 3A29-like, partial [Notechis scutatus]|uniref:Cytochrome P450 3A29-like n=1 Tax=Notechis scutatus TaxID=8663 RepID=A0A6J1WBW1_9SAUR
DFGLCGNLDTSLNFVADDQWRRIRNAFSPTFTSGRLKEMMPIINHYNEILEKNIQKKVENDEITDVEVIFSGYSLDVATSIAFSVNIDSVNHPNDLVVVHMKNFLRFKFFNPVLILAGKMSL